MIDPMQKELRMKDELRPRTARVWRPQASDAALAADAPVLRKLWHSTRRRWRRILLGIFVGWAGYLLLLSPEGWLQLWRLRRQARDLRAEITRLDETKAALDHVLTELSEQDAPLLERRAREEFGFARDNERLYLLPYDARDRRCVRQGELQGGERFLDREAPARERCDEPRAGSHGQEG
ncbi:MAG: hypothetical protein GF330_02950 [Candidatus Eisenbacteria bacterium]|nr:hypothetical protein [Candidatus Eisenbacteria bacterium]